MTDNIIKILKESISVKKLIIESNEELEKINSAASEIIIAFKNNKKILIAGNGGSAADAQHIAAEFVGRYLFDRPPLNAVALHANTSSLTAIANDYGYDKSFSRQVEAMGESGDILLAISTSGNSENILTAIEIAKRKKVFTIGMTGKDGGKMNNVCDICIRVPSNFTPRIQEAHITIGHIICGIVEEELFSEWRKK